MTWRRAAIAVAVVAASTVAVYAPILSSLVHQWASDENYSHGFIIVPFAAWFAWQQRRALAAAPAAPSAAGLIVVGGSLLVLLAGLFGAELFLTRVSLVGLIAGTVLYLFGWAYLRRLAFPIGLLLLAIPLPAVLFNQIAFPLQLLASRTGEAALSLANVPVLREGNILVLPTTTLEVAQACSGIRSLMSLLALGVILGKLSEPRRWARVVLAFLTIPVAIAANAARVAGTGLAASYVGAEAAEGFFHTFSGWLVFVVAFALLMAAQRGLARIRGGRPGAWHRAVAAAQS
jgi:exosortase